VAAVELAIVATKVDKLSMAERTRALKQLESVFEHSVLPVSAVTGEGLDELWTLIDNLTNNRSSRSSRKPTRKSSPNRPNSPNRLPKATAGLLTEAPRLPTKARRRPKR
jgi:50S ribosomal subunit-associated GTPase HflX